MTGLSRAKMLVAIVLGVLGALIVFQNFQPVATNVLFWRLTLPHVVFLAIVFGAGCILGAVLAVMWCIRQFKDKSTT
jgi:uncharacterized integral membrane protein